ncbi:hypothetical protein GCM10010415_26900 [Streptomyces atrovirens]|uniref:PfkB family carbohydrate kinase n=1 Tax=Streptomyces atrovirens TaxID=285556 RepID=A0ABW0DXQ7_9ACTN
MAGSPQYFDLITMGRIGVDLYPLETGVPLARVETFGKFPGGSAANAAVAAARKGRSTAVIARTGDDPFGTFPHEALKESGADARPYCREALPEAGVEPAVVEQGSRGVFAVHRDGTRAEVPPVPVGVVTGLGAGDAFGGSLCHGPLAGRDPERTMRHAHAAGALVASRLARPSATPTGPEVADLLARAASPDAAGLPSQS